MKKLISITLRLVLAAAGIGYIVWTLSWHDQVIVPAGYVYADGAVAGQDTALKLLSHDSDGLYTLQGPGEGELVRVAVPEDDISADQPRHKPGIVSMLRDADWKLLVIGVVLMLPVFPIQAVRWWLLMRCRGMHVPIGKAMRLTMVGLFFNFCMPGMTGGDVVKAYYAAKGSGARGVAVMSVIFDRVAGLLGLVLLAGIAGLVLLMRGGLDADVYVLVRNVTGLIWLGFFGNLVMAYLYFSRRIRRGLGLQRLIDKLGPGNVLVRIDDAAAAYREHKGLILVTILISLPVHFCQALATTCAGWALGMGLGAGLMLTVLPVLFLAGSVPLTYQGLGVMEALAVAMLLPSPVADANQLVSMLVVLRLFLILYALIGAVQVLRGNIHLFPQTDVATDEEGDGTAGAS
ncbi:MAG: lysylphosphatidylglycerol synthase transmembrane domain-containing protein [Phycisphaerales bacterium]